MSVRYLIPDPVIGYIYENNLYMDDGTTQPGADKGKAKEESTAAN